MKRGEKAARAAVKAFLQNAELPVMLWTVSVKADEAARDAGRNGDLFDSLHDYQDMVIDAGFKVFWVGNDSGSLLMVGTEEQWLANRQHRPMPGVFDAAVDMGPQFAKS